MKSIIYSFAFLLIIVACDSNNEESLLEDKLKTILEQRNPVQIFQISNKRDTIISGKLGTKVFIPSSSLINKSGEAPQNVTIRLKEVYSLSEMLLNGLSTMSNDNILSSSGMINLQAFEQDEELMLKDSAFIKIAFNKVIDKPFMRTYLGEKDESDINWELDGNNYLDTVYFTITKDSTTVLAFGDEVIMEVTTRFGIVLNDTFQVSDITNYIGYDNDTTGMETYRYPIDYYAITSTKLNWINCDYFIVSDDNVAVKIVETENKLTTRLIFPDLNAVMSQTSYANDTLVFVNIPRGTNTLIVGYGLEENDLVFSKQETTVNTNNEIYTHSLNKVTMDELVKELESLDLR